MSATCSWRMACLVMRNATGDIVAAAYAIGFLELEHAYHHGAAHAHGEAD
jgi:hypothetical protein